MSFGAAVGYDNGATPQQVVLGPVAGGTLPDIVTADGAGNSLSVLENLGSGSFSQPATLSSAGSGNATTQIALGNFTGGSAIDAAVINSNCTVGVMAGNGDGTFQAESNIQTIPQCGSLNVVAAGDVNGDGHTDLVIAGVDSIPDSNSCPWIWVLDGNGQGGFSAPTAYGCLGNTYMGPSGLALADLRGNGRLDIVVAEYASAFDNATIVTMSNNGDGTFAAATQVANSGSVSGLAGDNRTGVQRLAVADVTGDGVPDIIVTAQGTFGGNGPDYPGIEVYVGNGDGTFANGVNVPDPALRNPSGGGYNISAVAVADINGDGIPDIVTAQDNQYGPGGFSVYPSHGGPGLNLDPAMFIADPGFAPSGANTPFGLALGDVNGDGRPDVVLENTQPVSTSVPANVDVLLNQTQAPPAAASTTGGSVPGDHPTTCAGCPVNTATGEFYKAFTDLSVPGRGMALDLTRTYSTNLAAADSPFGFGWTDSYNWFLSTDSATGDVTVHESNGSQVVFAPNGSGGFNGPSSDFAVMTKDSTSGDYTYARDTGQRYVFNAAGQLIQETDRNGYATKLSYSGGNLATVTDPAGRTLSFSYGANGKVASVTDPAGRAVTYAYDPAGDLTSATDVGKGTWKFGYDSSHRILTMTDPRGGVTTLAYDSSGRATSWTDPMGRATTFAYTAGSGGSLTTSETDARGDVTTWTYQNLELTAVTRGAGTSGAATTSYTYDPATFGATSVTDPNGNTTTSTYDASGNLLSTTDPLGHTTSYTYNAFNQVLTVTDALGVTTTNTYDAHGNLLSTSTPVGTKTATTSYVYGDSAHPGDLTKLTNPDGHAWSYTYDRYGNRISITDPLGAKTAYTYNVIGERTSATTPLGHKTTYTYDAFGDPRTVTDPLGNKTTKAYDANQNLVKTIDANGDTTTRTYDADNEPTRVTVKNPAGTVLRSQATKYDKAGDVASQVNGLGQATTYHYDALNRETSVTDPAGRTTTYAYDKAGNRISLTDPQGRVTSYGYNAADQLTSISYSDGVTPNVTFGYDADGQRVSMTDGTGTSTIAYDALHRVTGDTQGGGAQVAYGYDLSGDLTSITYPNGKAVTRAYDAAGRLTAVTDWLGHTTSFGYNADAELTTETYPNGVAGSFTYDNAGQLTGGTDTKGTATLLSLAYTRDKAGLLTVENSTSYGYDGADRLISSTTGPSPLTYNKADQLTGLGPATLSYDAASELTTQTSPAGTTSYGYDRQGDRTSATPPSGPAAGYTYDQAGRLTGFNAGTTTASYSYNGTGLRVAKKVGATTTAFTWDLAEGLPLTIQAGPTSYLTGPGGLPVEQIDGTTVLYYAHDQLGSTRLLTNASGNPAATFSYGPYGLMASHTGTATTRFGFAGQYADTESGLIYLRARYYDPATGQFLTLDPAVSVTGQPYSYAGLDPANVTDPSGLDSGGLSITCDQVGGGIDDNIAAQPLCEAVAFLDFQRQALAASYENGSYLLGLLEPYSSDCEAQAYISQIQAQLSLLQSQYNATVQLENQLGQALNQICAGGGCHDHTIGTALARFGSHFASCFVNPFAGIAGASSRAGATLTSSGAKALTAGWAGVRAAAAASVVGWIGGAEVCAGATALISGN